MKINNFVQAHYCLSLRFVVSFHYAHHVFSYIYLSTTYRKSTQYGAGSGYWRHAHSIQKVYSACQIQETVGEYKVTMLIIVVSRRFYHDSIAIQYNIYKHLKHVSGSL